MQRLPFELLASIVQHCDTKTVMRLRLVNRAFNQAGKHILTVRSAADALYSQATGHAKYHYHNFNLPPPSICALDELEDYIWIMTKLEVIANLGLYIPPMVAEYIIPELQMRWLSQKERWMFKPEPNKPLETFIAREIERLNAIHPRGLEDDAECLAAAEERSPEDDGGKLFTAMITGRLEYSIKSGLARLRTDGLARCMKRWLSSVINSIEDDNFVCRGYDESEMRAHWSPLCVSRIEYEVLLCDVF